MTTQILPAALPLISASFAEGETHLLIGTGSGESLSLTTRRLQTLQRSGAHAIVVNPSSDAHYKVIAARFPEVEVYNRPFQLSDLTTLGRVLTAKVVDRVYVNLPFVQCSDAKDIYAQCAKLRIPINTYQQPEHSTFNMLPTYTDPKGSGLQITVTTNGCGYVLANRIKREIINSLPANISQIVANMATLRNQVIADNNERLLKEKFYSADMGLGLGFGLDDDVWESHKLNTLIREFDVTKRNQQTKRTRWLSQVMEYYPLAKLADITMQELENNAALQESNPLSSADTTENAASNTSHTDGRPLKIQKVEGEANSTVTVLEGDAAKQSHAKKGSISLVGSGPGSVAMLTIGALHEIKTADIILADKLVPQTVLNLIPAETETFIARKFPGNAERAQQELLAKGMEALEQGRKVVRLKQGDPYIFGRGGEEFLYFQEHGYEPTVLPGLSSSLTSTVVAKIPATHRDVADQVLVCTGTGRKGVLPKIPEFVPSRTTVFLMALHRAKLLTQELLAKEWDENVPVAIVERASCPDQRVTRTLLKYLPEVVEEIGSRPPGLLVVGKAVTKLVPESLVQFTDERKHYIEEGYSDFEFDVASLIK